MPRAVAQPLDPFTPPVRSRAGGDTQSGDQPFWRLLAEHGPDRAQAVVENPAVPVVQTNLPETPPTGSVIPNPVPTDAGEEAQPVVPQSLPAATDPLAPPLLAEERDEGDAPLDGVVLPENTVPPDGAVQPESEAPTDGVALPESKPQPEGVPLPDGELPINVPIPVESSAPVNPPTIAAAILASYQPLTIRSLTTQLLQVQPNASPDGTQATEAKNQATPTGSTGAFTGSRGAAVDFLSQAADAAPRSQDQPNAHDSRSSGEFAAETFAANEKRPYGSDHQAEAEPRSRDEQRAAEAGNAAPGRVSQQQTAAPPAGAAAAMDSSVAKPLDAANPRQAPAPAPLVASVSGAAGRKAGEDAHMPRWDAQKLALSKQQDETVARTSALVTAQAARGLAAAMTRQDGAVTLRLNPASLGFLRIRIEMAKGSVVARFEASTQQARQLLERSSETLRASLEAKGWETSQVRVELLREADPAAEMLRRLEQFGESAAARQAAQDATAGQDRGSGSSGGDRRNENQAPDSSAHDRADEPGATGDPVGELAGASSVIGVWSRLDTIV